MERATLRTCVRIARLLLCLGWLIFGVFLAAAVVVSCVVGAGLSLWYLSGDRFLSAVGVIASLLLSLYIAVKILSGVLVVAKALGPSAVDA